MNNTPPQQSESDKTGQVWIWVDFVLYGQSTLNIWWLSFQIKEAKAESQKTWKYDNIMYKSWYLYSRKVSHLKSENTFFYLVNENYLTCHFFYSSELRIMRKHNNHIFLESWYLCIPIILQSFLFSVFFKLFFFIYIAYWKTSKSLFTKDRGFF